MAKVTATMAAALAHAHDAGGRLSRYAGGYWSHANAPRDSYGRPVDFFGTTTIEALVTRGRMRYVEWKRGKVGQFPVTAEVVPKETT